ncbi:MAG: hypothetical protein PVF70_03230 [Anaerolineales bacterium]|jgi:hypothetical protein
MKSIYAPALEVLALMIVFSLVLLASVAVVATALKPAWEGPVAILRIGIGAAIPVLIWVSAHWPRRLAITGALRLPSIHLAVLMPGFLR